MSEFFLNRHSKAQYKEYEKILKSDAPQAPFDNSKQDSLDLTEEGKRLADKNAERLLAKLNPEQDELFFVSSNEVRAIETADIYRRKAIERNFHIIKPGRVKDAFAQKIAEDQVRPIETLSLNTQNTLLFMVFSGSMPTVNWEGVDLETKIKWKEARELIDQDNKGSWGANFLAYSEKIKKIFPTIETAKKFHDTKFQNILRLVRWANKKIEADPTKKIKILAFGHEDYLVYMLRQEFSEQGIQNCEMIELNVNKNKSVTVKFKNKERIFPTKV